MGFDTASTAAATPVFLASAPAGRLGTGRYALRVFKEIERVCLALSYLYNTILSISLSFALPLLLLSLRKHISPKTLSFPSLISLVSPSFSILSHSNIFILHVRWWKGGQKIPCKWQKETKANEVLLCEQKA